MSLPLPELDGVEHRFVDLPGLRMHIAEAGSGEPLLLLHGWPQHWWVWRRLIPGLAERYRLICPDLRGFGWSEAPEGGYETDQLADDIVRLLDALGLERVRLIGHDWGGYICFLICLRHPGRIERHISLNTAQPFPQVDGRTLATLWRFWYQLVIAAPGLGPRLVGGGRQGFMRFLQRWNRSEGAWSADDTELFLAPLRQPARAWASTALYRTFLVRELLPYLRGRHKSRRLRTPTLLLGGARDPVLRPAFLRGHEPYADDMRFELVPDCGHLLPEERPEVVLSRALDFFAA